MPKQNEEKKIGSSIEQLNTWYEDSNRYLAEIGLNTTIPTCVKFYEGDQWAKPTKDTKFFPRPVVNIIEMNCNNKGSQVLSSPVKIIYNNNNKDIDTEKFNRFAEYEQARLRQDDFNYRAIIDGMVKGSWCFYYFWDKDIPGVDGLIEGDMGLQLVDPHNVRFANPTEKDEQKQEWIMIISRENIEKIKENADSDINKDKICDDESDSIYNETESETIKFATVMTRFFRHNGEVYYERATKGVVFNKARPFTPNVEHFKSVISGEEEKVEQSPKESNKYIREPKINKYPIVFSSWKERDKSIYGRGEVEAIIPNQKAINWTLGLQILIAQNEGMSPAIVKPDALRGQKITNEPGQVLTDYSKTGNGISFPNKPGMTQASVNLVDKIADLTRVAIGSSEVMNGEVLKAGMSGAAIAQLQAQALKPIEAHQKNFWRSMEKAGEVLEQYFKFFFKKKKYQYKDKDNNLIDDEFNSEDYKGVIFDVTAEAVAGTVMSDVADINLLETLLAKGAISNVDYVKCLPNNSIANRDKIIESIEHNDITQQQFQQLQQQLAQASEILKQQEQTINNASTVINENKSLKERLYALQAEYTAKMQQANQILLGLATKTKEYRDDASLMANEVAKQRGINTGTPTDGSINNGSPGASAL